MTGFCVLATLVLLIFFLVLSRDQNCKLTETVRSFSSYFLL